MPATAKDSLGSTARTAARPKKVPIYVFADFQLDVERYELRRGDQQVRIAPKPLDVLIYLIQHRGHAVSRQELIKNVWGATTMSLSTVPTCISALRKALADNPANPRLVYTTPGRGYRFIASVQSDDGDGLPAITQHRPEPVFVGREGHLAGLREALAQALAGRSQLALVTGEPGIGKTRTVDEFLKDLTGDSPLPLVARCLEAEGAPAFWPWVQILRAFLDRLGPEALQQGAHGLESILADLAPELCAESTQRSALPPLDPPKARFRLFDALMVFLRRVARERPLVLVLDDLHRADEPSIRLLRFAVAELKLSRILFVGTYREAELRMKTALDDKIARLARESSLHTIPLGPLTVEDVAQFLRQVAPETAGHEDLAVDLQERSGGNPFFLSQLVALKKQQRDRADCTSAPRAHAALPTALRSTVVSHLASIPPATRRLLSVAAVIGREFDLSILSVAAGKQLDQIHATLEPALSSGLVSKHKEISSVFSFSHVLLRDALYDSLRSAQRASLHSAVGGALERIHSDDLAPHASQLAYHFSQASGSEAADKTVLYSTRAGEWSTECHAYEDAPRHFEAALLTASREGCKTSNHRCEMEIRLAEAWLAAGRSDLARTTVESASSVARRLGNPSLFARSALVLAPGFFATQVGLYDPLIVSLLEEAIAGKDMLDPGTRAQLLARLAIALVWSDSEGRRESLTREALETARQSADPEALVYALCARHGVLWEPDRRSERESVIDELGDVAGSLRKPEFALIYRLFRVTSLLEQAHIPAIDHDIAVFTRIAEDLALPHFLWQAKLLDATRNLMTGRFRKAERLAEEFFTLGHRAEQENTLHCFAAHLAIHRWEQGRSAEIMPGLEELVEQYPSVYAWRAVRAFLLTEVERFDAARAEVEGIASRGLQNLPKNETWMMSLNLLAEACVRLRDVERSAQLYDLLLPAAGACAVLGFGVAFWGSQARALGLLATALERWSEAEFHFEIALRHNERAGALPWVAHTHHDYAQMLFSRGSPGDSHRAQAHANAALTTAKSIGMANLEEKARRTIEAE